MIGPSWNLHAAQSELYRLERQIRTLEADRRELVGLVAEMLGDITQPRGLKVGEWRARLAEVLEGG